MTISSQATSAGFAVIKWLAIALVILWLFREIFPSLAGLEKTGLNTATKDATNTAFDAGTGAYVGVSQGIGEQLGLPDDLTKYGFGSIGMFVAGLQKFLGISSQSAPPQGGTLGGGDLSQLVSSYDPNANIPSAGVQQAISTF